MLCIPSASLAWLVFVSQKHSHARCLHLLDPLLNVSAPAFMFSDDLNDYLEPTSTGLSRFLLDTYDDDGDMEGFLDHKKEAVRQGGDAGEKRPPRYGAFVFGDRIMLNLTVEWDKIRDNPAFFGMALETVTEVLPPEGGAFDLKVRRCFGVCFRFFAGLGAFDFERCRMYLLAAGHASSFFFQDLSVVSRERSNFFGASVLGSAGS